MLTQAELGFEPQLSSIERSRVTLFRFLRQLVRRDRISLPYKYKDTISSERRAMAWTHFFIDISSLPSKNSWHTQPVRLLCIACGPLESFSPRMNLIRVSM